MKRLIFVFCILVSPAIATDRSCPSGYKSSSVQGVIAGTCPSYTMEVRSITTTSCFDQNADARCFLYLSEGTPYTDDTGTYEYTDACRIPSYWE